MYQQVEVLYQSRSRKTKVIVNDVNYEKEDI